MKTRLTKILRSEKTAAGAAFGVAFSAMGGFQLVNHWGQDYLTDSAIHWTTSLIAGLIVAVIAWVYVRKLHSVHLQMGALEIQAERTRTHQATMVATYHYLNNALNQFQLVLLQLDAKGFVDKEILEEIKASINKTAKEMQEFGYLENPTRENVEKFINEHL